jgi:hypothetical protein
MNATDATNGFLDLHGREVHAFSMRMANLGYAEMADLLLSMLKSPSWRSFTDGTGTYAFLPGEFDYFLTQQGVRHEDVMKGVADLDRKAELEAAMDERRTGEENYRRPILQARAENPRKSGRPIEPFGLTKAEAKALVKDSAGTSRLHDRPALGESVRRFTNTGTARRQSRELPLVERLRRSALRLDNDDLTDLIDSLKQEQKRRRRGKATS